MLRVKAGVTSKQAKAPSRETWETHVRTRRRSAPPVISSRSPGSGKKKLMGLWAIKSAFDEGEGCFCSLTILDP